MKNLGIAFGKGLSPIERSTTARLSYYHFCLTIFETLQSIRLPIDRSIKVEGGEHLKSALSKGQGVYVICGHFGNWEAMPSVVSKQFAQSFTITKSIGSKSVNQFIEDIRKKNGFNIIRRNKKGDGFQGIKNALKNGKIVGFVFDQTRPGEPKLNFFNTPSKTNTSFAAIWQKCPAPIVPMFIVREDFGEHTIYFEREIDDSHLSNDPNDILKMSSYFNTVIEQIVRKAPEQYFWMHNRWR